ncbi:MAG: DUF5320 domain-containing protein [archaeon]
MPGQDRTGPQGQGPMTGRGLGLCGTGMGKGFGRGMGRGFGRGMNRGYRWRMTPVQVTETEEKKILQEELELLREDVKEIEKRLKELKSTK